MGSARQDGRDAAENGLGVPKDLAKAFALYSIAAEKNIIAAWYSLGCMYQDGRGVAQDSARPARGSRRRRSTSSRTPSSGSSPFAVQAGKPVQIVLANPDAMPHNLVVGQPGSLQEIGTKGSLMPLPTDPEAKPYVPDTPLVLYASRLLSEGETERLNFTAPAKPGEYVYVCTFPGHWIRMYGVMLVVDNLDAWEAKPTVPTDPATNKPFTSQKN